MQQPLMPQLDAPIPGQSLTTEPKKYPYERPVQKADPKEVLDMYLEKLSDKDRLTDVLDMLELGMDVKTVTEGITRAGVANGVHTIDVSLLVAPVLHEYIKSSADKAGVDYSEGLEEDTSEKDKAVKKAKVLKALKAPKEDASKEPPTVEIEEIIKPGKGKGLMAKRGK